MDEIVLSQEPAAGRGKTGLPLHRGSHAIAKQRAAKVRIVHILAPEIINTDAANFRDLVQRLTGRSSTNGTHSCIHEKQNKKDKNKERAAVPAQPTTCKQEAPTPTTTDEEKAAAAAAAGSWQYWSSSSSGDWSFGENYFNMINGDDEEEENKEKVVELAVPSESDRHCNQEEVAPTPTTSEEEKAAAASGGWPDVSGSSWNFGEISMVTKGAEEGWGLCGFADYDAFVEGLLQYPNFGSTSAAYNHGEFVLG